MSTSTIIVFSFLFFIVLTSNPPKTPSSSPSKQPSTSPSNDPTTSPSKEPTSDPTYDSTKDSTMNPTNHDDATSNPTSNPSYIPTLDPTDYPTPDPTMDLSIAPTSTSQPTLIPSTTPSLSATVSPTYGPTISDDIEQDDVLLNFGTRMMSVVGICIASCCLVSMVALWLNYKKRREKRKIKTDIVYKDNPISGTLQSQAISAPTASTSSQYTQRQNIPMAMRHNLPFGGNLGAMAVNSNSMVSNVTIPMSISNNVNVIDLQPQHVINHFQNVAMNADELKTDNNNQGITIGHDDHITRDQNTVGDDGTGTENTTGTSDEGTKEISSHASNSINNDGEQLQIATSSKMKIKLDENNVAWPVNIQTKTGGQEVAFNANDTTTGGGPGSV